ncbi:MAG: S8 family peptidase [Pararobbsia sp.]
MPAELSATHADYLSHGTEVTSALLFGVVERDATLLPRPYFNVVHHRVLGFNDEYDVDLYDCMRRIDEVLRAGDVDFANLSLGPRLAIDDGQPHAWTAMLDGHLAHGRTLMAVAVGNDGNLPEGMGRIQPPADAVNALSVGAADSREFMWSRASYSCYGPGRSPGLVKPDGLAFGGTEQQPLVLLNPLAGGLTGVQGTSFASPLALRTAAAARAVSATALNATTLRALMIHRADRFQGHDARDVGWGRFPESADDLLTCGDHEVCVIYQGHIEAGGTTRIGIPVPPVALGVGLTIKATFCFASPIDPADPINYTRHGLTVVFRPRGAGSSASFFSTGNYDTEQDLRTDAYKWETVLHRTAHFAADELLDACFDVDHGAREHGLKVDNSEIPPLPYVLAATVSTQKGEHIYESIMQKYRALAPIRLRERVRLRPR